MSRAGLLRPLARALFRLARTRPAGWLVRAGFAYGAALLPVRRVAQTDRAIAFHHPAPSWRPHVLVVPRRPIPSFLSLRTEHAPLFGEIVRLAFSLAETHALYVNGFAVLVNGGAYQDVSQLHVHLAGLDAGLTYHAPDVCPDGPPLAETTRWVARPHPRPERAVHLVIRPRQPVRWRDLAGTDGTILGQELAGIGQALVRQLGGMESGFTLLASVPPGGADEPVCWHLVGGARQAGG
ncbi:MAG: HIT domain-containing protein [Chloroflexota bacterium]